MRTKCKLCKVKRTLWETKNFFGIRCKLHFVPMIILKEHRIEITEDEKIELSEICKEKYSKMHLDNSFIDSDDHWHIHLSKKNKFVAV